MSAPKQFSKFAADPGTPGDPRAAHNSRVLIQENAALHKRIEELEARINAVEIGIAPILKPGVEVVVQ